MNVIATDKGYYQRRRRPGDAFALDSDKDFRPSWMVNAEEFEKAKQETRPMTLSEVGASKADSFVAVMSRNRVVQKTEKPPAPVKAKQTKQPTPRSEPSLDS